MFVDNLKTDFYDIIQGNRCLLLVNFDVDAICACKILQHLFKNDNMLYTLAPVQGIQDMVRAYEDNCEELKYVIMLNCGGTIDIVELLEPPEELIFFVLDSHRPFDVCNIYSESQIRILNKPNEDDEIPEYHEIFREESEDEDADAPAPADDDDDDNEVNNTDEEEEVGESRQSKRRRLNEEVIIKRRERREWERTRDTRLFNYMQYSYYSRSSAVLVFEMAWKMSKDNLDIVWWAIIGSTEQSIIGKIEERLSILEDGNLQGHVSRLTHQHGIDIENQSQSTVRITYDKDLQLPLYRHWTVDASLRHSTTAAVSLRLYSIRGEKRLKEFLVEMGLPLDQARQKFTAMDLNLRHEFQQMVSKLATKYNIENIVGTSFTLQYGYRFKYCASDVVYGMLALMESTTKDRPPQLCFLDALDCLSRVKKDTLELGIVKAKLMLTNIFKSSQSILEMKQVRNSGTFLYVIIPDGTLDSKLFVHPNSLIMLAQFTLRAYVEQKKTRQRNILTFPLIASAVFDPDNDTCIVVGIPPVGEDQPKSLFGRAFEQAAKNTNSQIDMDYFDTTIIRLKISERPKFFDALAALLT